MNTIKNTDEFYNVKDAAKKLGLAEPVLRKKLNAQEIKGYKKGKFWYVLHKDMLTYITTQK